MYDEARPQYATMIRDLPQGERPRERLREYGPNSLSNAELMAILLRTGVEGQNVGHMSREGDGQWVGWDRGILWHRTDNLGQYYTIK